MTYRTRVKYTAEHDCMAGIVPDNPAAFPPSMEVSAEGTITGKESVESSQEQRPRKRLEPVFQTESRNLRCGIAGNVANP